LEKKRKGKRERGRSGPDRDNILTHFLVIGSGSERERSERTKGGKKEWERKGRKGGMTIPLSFNMI